MTMREFRIGLATRGHMITRRVLTPSPQQIASRCAEIQRGWSDEEHERRRVGGERSWSPQVYSEDAFTLNRSKRMSE